MVEYKTVRYGIEVRVWLVSEKKDTVVLKRTRDAIDSWTISKAKFVKYYSKV